MGFFNKYPYTDFHELNLDWVISKIKELELRINEVFNSIIEHILENVFINSDYEAETETLTLFLDIKKED